MTKVAPLADYPAFLEAVKERILAARKMAVRAVNRGLVLHDWDIGRGIVEKQRSAAWGEGVVERLASDLRAAFPETRPGCRLRTCGRRDGSTPGSRVTRFFNRLLKKRSARVAAPQEPRSRLPFVTIPPRTAPARCCNSSCAMCHGAITCFDRHAYFPGANDPYDALKTTLKAEIDADACATLHSNTSRPFDKPQKGRIAVKVIDHLGDEVMNVFEV